MSRDFRARSMRAALKRLEKSIGKGQRHCPWCRVNYRHLWPDPGLPKPSKEVLVKYRCWVCGTDMIFNFADLPDEEREVLRLNYSFSMEDIYTNTAAIALEVWLLIYPKGEKAKGPQKSSVSNDADDPGARMRAKLNEEAEVLLNQKRSRLAARYGDPYLKVKDIIASVQKAVVDKRQAHFGIRGLPESAQEQKVYLICAELEKIIWGRLRLDTASAIERLEQTIRQLIEDERLRREAEEEELKCKKAQEEEGARRAKIEEEAAGRKKEAEERKRPTKTRWRSKKPYDPMSGLHVFNYEAYEREIASGKHPSGQILRHLQRR